ncbi:lysozyme [Streptomyces qinglanensis]|uniref:lysozyme n=1 Tax=Streptomyces qinglanensis TaxID=943816 RepID=A0A1E7K946_9ACTN|nr:lysozyme [Streptomyces qinglanensis]MBE9497819.1 lysozyme [Streptomyces sp. GKU 257-1]OEV00357.1 lysozyme [Streptomyces qinglanensis]OEV28763.1 lysozyme [Streptomyces nanshensis]
MPSFRSGTARRRRGIAAVIGMFVSLLALVLALPGAASAASGNGDGGTKSAKATTPGKASESAKSTEGLRGNPKAPAKRGEAWMGAGVRMHEGDSTDGTQPDKNRAGLLASVHGVDVSSHQGNVAWSTLWNSGVRFAYAKATEGTSYKNPYFAQQYNGSYNVGMIRGAYHFALPNSSSGATQANYFASNGGGWSKDGKTLPGVLDIEYNPYGATCFGLSKSAMVNWIKDFTSTYKARTGRDAVIYTTTSWWTQCTGNSSAFGNSNPLWIARYASSPGTLPAGWGFYTFWQYTSSGPTVGDHDYFNGSMTRLKVLANGG